MQYGVDYNGFYHFLSAHTKMGLSFERSIQMIKVFKNLKKQLAILLVATFMLSSTAFAAEAESEIREVENSDSVLEIISELEQDESNERVFYFPETYSTVVPVAAYNDWRFSSRSAKEFLDLDMPCDTISLTATCTEAGATDNLGFYIIDYTHDGAFNTLLPFTADGSVTTIARSLPAGHYAVYFTGDANIQKAKATAIFAKFD